MEEASMVEAVDRVRRRRASSKGQRTLIASKHLRALTAVLEWSGQLREMRITRSVPLETQMSGPGAQRRDGPQTQTRI